MKDPRNEGEAYAAMAPREQRGYRFSGAMKPPVQAQPKPKRKSWLQRRLDAIFKNFGRLTP